MGKGQQTRTQILSAALSIAKSVGLGGLTIGMLAERLSMSKSGVFAHFGSKEELQLAVLEQAQHQFAEQVMSPALQAPRGLARLTVLFDGWLAHSATLHENGGCLMIQTAAEFDDQPGPVRDQLIAGQRWWREALAKAVRLAVESGELAADSDCAQLAFELFGLALAAHHDSRLFGEAEGAERARRGLQRLLRSAQPSTPVTA